MGETPSELQQLTMNVYSNEECTESGIYYSRNLTDNMICAGYMEAGKASCHVSFFDFSQINLLFFSK